jgi:hypothetical protein
MSERIERRSLLKTLATAGVAAFSARDVAAAEKLRAAGAMGSGKVEAH